MTSNRKMGKEKQNFVVLSVTRRLSSEAEKIAKEVAGELIERQKVIERSSCPCPVDGKGSSYMGSVGTYQIAVPVL